jgi:hypothetical protein
MIWPKMWTTSFTKLALVNQTWLDPPPHPSKPHLLFLSTCPPKPNPTLVAPKLIIFLLAHLSKSFSQFLKIIFSLKQNHPPKPIFLGPIFSLRNVFSLKPSLFWWNPCTHLLLGSHPFPNPVSSMGNYLFPNPIFTPKSHLLPNLIFSPRNHLFPKPHHFSRPTFSLTIVHP